MKRSKFNLSHTQLLTCDMGQLIPVGLTEVLPGDSFQHACQALIRCAPLAVPPMHPVRIDIRHFFVPHRLVWDEWEDFITGGPDGTSTPVFPTCYQFNPSISTLADYLGIPPNLPPVPGLISALPFRGYNLIYNEFYRDQDLVPPLVVSKGSGVDTTTTGYVGYPQNVAWEKDYFTTARPFEQKGPEVTLPLGTSATGTALITGIRDLVSNTLYSPLVAVDGEHGAANGSSGGRGAPGIPTDRNVRYEGTVDVDLSTATAASVNDLRLALALQRYEEARARFGSRYTEYLRYLGVRSSDARLQRPEYLGGSRSNLQFSEVLSTNYNAGSEQTDLPGVYGGHGIGANRTNRYRRFFEEHGYVFTLMSVLPQTMYPDGIFRTWLRRTKEDFWQKELQHIGQQEVYRAEVKAQGITTPNDFFGYQDRYDEYRRSESQVHGEFRPGENLQDWTFARSLPSDVALNSDFVKAQPTKVPFQAQGEPTLYCAVRHQLVARRMVAPKGSSFIV